MSVRLVTDRTAASPLTVVAVVVVLAVLATTAAVLLLVDTEHEVLEVDVVEDAGARFLEVGRVEGRYAWGDLTLHLINQAGNDHAANYLQAPGGEVAVGDRIGIDPRPPAGDYLLEVRLGDQVLTQRVVTL